MIGCPGSGKSTWVKEQKLPFVSRDCVRAELGFCKKGEKYLGSKEEESMVTRVCDEKRKNLIEEGVDFAIDDTNVREGRRRGLIKELRDSGYYVVGVWMKTDLETCLRRREGEIPEGAIINMWEASQMVNLSDFDEVIEKVGI